MYPKTYKNEAAKWPKMFFMYVRLPDFYIQYTR